MSDPGPRLLIVRVIIPLLSSPFAVPMIIPRGIFHLSLEHILALCTLYFALSGLSTEAAGSSHQRLLDDEYGVDIVREVALKCEQPPIILKEALSDRELHELHRLVNQEGSVWLPMLWMTAVWIIVSVFALLRNGTFFKVETCSTVYWLLEFGIFPCLFVITFFIARYLAIVIAIYRHCVVFSGLSVMAM